MRKLKVWRDGTQVLFVRNGDELVVEAGLNWTVEFARLVGRR